MGVYLGDIELTMGKQGVAGKDGINGQNGADGADGQDGKSAYAIAVEQGYGGTEEQFGTDLANAVEVQMQFGRFNKSTVWNTEQTQYTTTWVYNGDSYQEVMTITEDGTQDTYVRQLTVNGVAAGTWTMVVTDTVSTTTYTA